MSIFAYFATATIATITIGGDGTALGFFSSSLSSNTTTNSLSQQESNPVTRIGTQDSFQSTPAPQESRSPREPQQIRETQNLSGEGNCLVEGGWEEKVIAHLPKEFKYVSFFCTNTGGYESSLTNWRGFMPEELFVNGAKSLLKGVRFYIAVEGKGSEGLSDSLYDVQATFTSDKFIGSSFTGKWGSKFIEDTDDGVDIVYEVELVGSGASDKFYLQWL